MSNENAIANLVGNVNTQLALVDTESSHEKLFPVLEQPAKTDRFAETESGTLEKLDGKKKVSGVILGARLDFIVYPAQYKEGVPAAEQAKPIDGGAVSLSSEHSATIKHGCEGYQFTKRDNKPAFEAENGGPGIYKASLSVLLYNADVDAVLHLRSWNGYNGVFANGACLSAFNSMMDSDGSIPVMTDEELLEYTFAAKTVSGFGGAVNAMYDVSCGPASAALKKSFGAVVEAKDEELNATIQKWLNCEDNPVSDAALKGAEAAWGIYQAQR